VLHKIFAVLVGIALWGTSSAHAQVINCPNGFSSDGACGIGIFQGGKTFQVVGTQNGSSPAMKGSQLMLLSPGANHVALSMNYQIAKVNDQAFTTEFTFVPNGWNIEMHIQNSTNNPWGFNGKIFSAGAGCEANFFQGFSQPEPVNNVFAFLLDQASPLTEHGSFSYSSVQYYKEAQSPCNPNLGGDNFTYYPTTKISTAPVPLNSPANAALTTTGDTYSAKLIYDGREMTTELRNVTEGGPTFTYTWDNVNIPQMAGGDTAWIGLGGATNQPVQTPLYINSWVYSEGRAQPTPSPAPTNTPAPSPTASNTPAPTPTPPELIDVPLNDATLTIHNGNVTVKGSLGR